jgi:hypothetical protein
MNWCDPCAASPLSREELKKLGVFWLSDSPDASGAADAFITRLHVRYDREHFPDDLVFQATGDKTNFQARYVLHHPWTGTADCDAARQYRRSLRDRREQEAHNLANLTGWPIGSIRKKMNLASVDVNEREKKWWEW